MVAPGFAAIVIAVELVGFTVIVMLLLATVDEVTQLTEDVMLHTITSPLVSVDEL